MNRRVLATICGVATLCIAAVDRAQELIEQDELQRVKESLAATIADNTSNVEIIDTNGFRVMSSQNEELSADLKPDGNQFQMLEVAAEGVFRVVVEKGRPMSTGGGLAIFHGDSGQPIFSVGDSDGDGSLDVLTYSKVDKDDGQALLDVIDYDVDGQPDFRVNFVEHYSELWHLDRWHRVENRQGRSGIILNDAFVELKRENNRFIVP